MDTTRCVRLHGGGVTLRRLTIAMVAMFVLVAVIFGCGGSDSGGSVGLIAFQIGTGNSASIMAVDADGSNLRLITASGREPSVRLDGRVLAYASGNDIFTIGTDGTGVTQVTSNSVGVVVSDPTISPAGDQVAYTIRPSGPSSLPQINVVNTDGTGEFTLTTNATQPSFSPSGNQIAFVRNAALFLINLDGTSEQNLTDGGAGVEAMAPSFSPSGAEIAFSARPNTATQIPNVRILGLANSQVTDLIENGIEPAFGPGGLRVAFIRNGALFTINRSATDLQQLTFETNASNPTWSGTP